MDRNGPQGLAKILVNGSQGVPLPPFLAKGLLLVRWFIKVNSSRIQLSPNI
jgi:hypothetical protein